MESIKLIDGQFTPEEANEILLDIITRKINFHKLKNLTSQVHYNQPNKESEVRLIELQEAKAQILALFKEAKEEHKDLLVEATLHLSIKDKKHTEELFIEVEGY
jgi:uncharacterized membrane protein YhiD involved in acid resistance